MGNTLFEKGSLTVKVFDSPWDKSRRQVTIMTTYEGYKPIVITDEDFTIIAKCWIELERENE